VKKGSKRGAMRVKIRAQAFFGLATSGLLVLPLSGFGQNPFPEGVARDTVLLVCSECHPLTRLIDSNMSASDWEFTLYDMIARGAPVHEEQIEVVRQYLIDNFAVDGQ
jgi:hypothetical protein